VFLGQAVDRFEHLRALADRVAGSYGLEVFDLQFRREASGLVLRVTIDRPGAAEAARPGEPGDSVGVDDCRRVSDDLGTLLDVEDAIDGAYTLEVSSPGLDRPLRGPADYERFRGRLAQFVAREAVGGQTHFRGRIQGVEGDSVVLLEGSRTHRVPLALVSRARLEVEF
jgi:ribosome maturation factor RimP